MSLKDGDGNTVQVNEPGRAFWPGPAAVFCATGARVE